MTSYIYVRPENNLHAVFESKEGVEKYLSGARSVMECMLRHHGGGTSGNGGGAIPTHNAIPVPAGMPPSAGHIKSAAQYRGSYDKSYGGALYTRILDVEIVQRKTLYGLYENDLFFLKVYLRDPRDMLRLAGAIEENAVAGIKLQPYEAHIPYLLKFTSDNNITPMGWLHAKKVEVRSSELFPHRCMSSM